MTDTTPDQSKNTTTSRAELEKEVAALRAKLAESEEARSEAEKIAAAVAELSAMSGDAKERPTGKTVMRKVCVNPWVQDKKDQQWTEVERPTYFYTLYLPLSAISLKTNGLEYFHGQTIEVDAVELGEYKSRVARCWDHESSISGSNENAYRQPTEMRVR